MGDRRTEAVTYLPAALVREASGLRSAELPWRLEVDGTMVMADLSGFTALSERLAKAGDEGAERLTAIINSFFERMLKTAGRCGGDTLTFGGDAILLLFDGPDHATRATVAALKMLGQVERAAAVKTDDGRIKIGMSVGAHSDRFVLVGAGLADERAHLVVLGRGGERTALAEAQADRGQLAVSDSCKELLPAGSSFQPAGEFWLVDELRACPLPRLSFDPPPVSDDQFRALAPFLPPYARDMSSDPGVRLQLMPEHRRTVIAFIDILGLDEIIERSGLDAAVGQLQAYAVTVAGLASKHSGFVVSSDIATKGSKLVVTFGAPVAHEYAPANAARFALDLGAWLRDSGLDLHHKIGVNGGHIFAGEVGPSFRRQYTVMGDAVNLAARLMAAADLDQVLVNRNLVDYLSHTVCACELPPIKVKGKEQPVAVCVLEDEEPEGPHIHGSLGQSARRGRMFGRSKELDLLARGWEQVRRGEGRAILVEGDAGVGKTRLLDEALQAMSSTGRVVRSACFEHLQAAPFTPWTEALHTIIGTTVEESTAERTEKFRVYLDEHLAESAEFGSLLNPLLNLDLPQSRDVAALEAQPRREKLLELVSRLLRGDGMTGRAVLIEDIHWMDESSLALAAYLLRHLEGSSTLLLLTGRPTEYADGFRAHLTHIELAELSEPESLAMVREALGVADLPAEVGETIYAKTKGNPLFLEEVIRSLREPGVLERIMIASSVRLAAELASLEIPDRVQGLLMSRIDRLAPDAREVLKAGAVVGRSFDGGLLESLHDERLRAIALKRALDELIAAELLVPEDDGESAAVSFRHALVQDVAYESLPFARRRGLHGEMAGYLESIQSPPDHALLVHHFGRAGDREKTRFHAVRAAESSVAVYANLEAVDFLDLALGTVHGRTSEHACLRSRLEEMTGDSLETLGRHDEAVDRFLVARRRWSNPAVRQACAVALQDLSPIDHIDARDSLLCWKIAVALERGRCAYRRALRWLDIGLEALPAGHETFVARMLVTKSMCKYRLGRYHEALRIGAEATALARACEDPGLQAYALTIQSLSLHGLARFSEAIACNTEAIGLYEEAGDLMGQATSHGNLALCYQLTGDLTAALEQFQISLGLHARIANATGVVLQNVNIGAALFQLGELEEATRHFEDVVAMRGDPACPDMTVGLACLLLGQVRVLNGDLEGAGHAFAEGREILEAIDSQAMLIDCDVAEAELRLTEGRLEQAEALCKGVLDRASSVGANECEALWMLGRVELAKGEPERAVEHLEQSLLIAEGSGADYQCAVVLVVLAEAKDACSGGDPACEDLVGEAISLFDQMGARFDAQRAREVRARLGATPA